MRLALFFISIFFLSQSGHWVRWSQAPPEVLGFWRLTLASGILLAWNFRHLNRHFTHHLKNPKARLAKVSRPTLAYAVFAGILFFAHLWAYKYQAHHTRIANGMILFASNPLFTALASIILFGEKITPRLLIAYLLAIGGIYNLVSHQLKFEPATLSGDLAAILAAALYSAYILTSRRARQQLDNREFTLILFSTAGLCFLLLGLTRGIPMWPETPQTWIAIAGLAIFSTILGHGLFAYLLNYMNINKMSCGKLLEPIFAALTAWLLFAEEISSTMVISFALTAASVLVLFLKNKDHVR